MFSFVGGLLYILMISYVKLRIKRIPSSFRFFPLFNRLIFYGRSSSKVNQQQERLYDLLGRGVIAEQSGE
jgi:hypothetical protein